MIGEGVDAGTYQGFLFYMKLELKHLAPYLPFCLKIKSNKTGEIFTLTGFSSEYEGEFTTCELSNILNEKFFGNFCSLKPILRPMSDFKLQFFKDNIDSDIIDFRFDCEEDIFSVEVYDKIVGWTGLSLQEYLLFFLNHFDVFGLIDAGLAIDINKVPELLNG